MSAETVAIATSRAFLKMKNRLQHKLKDGPIYLEVSKPILSLVLEFLNENFILYDVVDESDSTIILYVMYPEHYINIDNDIEKHSVKLVNPKVLKEAIRIGRIDEVGVIESPRQFIKYVREWSLAGKKLVLLTGIKYLVRGALLFVGGRLKAVWAEVVFYEVGVIAIRQLMFYGPYKYVLIRF